MAAVGAVPSQDTQTHTLSHTDTDTRTHKHKESSYQSKGQTEGLMEVAWRYSGGALVVEVVQRERREGQ